MRSRVSFRNIGDCNILETYLNLKLERIKEELGFTKRQKRRFDHIQEKIKETKGIFKS